ncbi:hypothetical protein ACNA96_001644 [Escherichia coli]
MNPPINFLPWRQQRRTAFLRFWLLMFVAPLLLAVGITLILRLTSNAEARVNAVLLQAEQQLARSLQITKPRLLERQQLREQRLQRQRQRQFTRDWQSALEAVPSAFTRLAERNVSVSRFLLSVEGDDLLFTLQLETPHEG